ncbi:MAG: VWA domain-containing protein, partial [Bacteroidota bacterium]
GMKIRIAKDLIFWLRKVNHQVFQKHPYGEELRLLAYWAGMPQQQVLLKWSNLLTGLRGDFTEDQIPVSFYQTAFAKISDGKSVDQIPTKAIEQFDRLYKDLLATWDAVLQSMILEYQLKHLKKAESDYSDLMESKLTEFKQLKKLLNPFGEYLGRYWDLSGELWQKSAFDLIQHYDALLEKEETVRKLADLLGRLREAELEMEEESIEKSIIRKEWQLDEFSKAEIDGIRQSDDFNHMLSSEAALLAEPLTEDLFLKKYAEQQLLSFRFQERKLVTSQDHEMEIYRKVKQKEKGPFIVCVDTSESMLGQPELIAKVLCMALIKIAARDNRGAFLINFSSGIEVIDLFDLNRSLDKVAEFLNMSFYGGTDISLPLYEAMRQLRGNRYKDADVVIISDFIMYQVDKDVLEQVKYFQQHQGAQFHSITLSKQANLDIIHTFDTNWLYDRANKGIFRDLNIHLNEISDRY